jgi:hypothetical protein
MSDSSWSRRGVDGRVKPGHDDEGLRRSRKKARPTGIAIRARLSPEPFSLGRTVKADTDGAAYIHEALEPATEVDHEHDFVADDAGKIPDTYGAPKREHAAAAE